MNIGVLGGGQLGRMLALAGIPHGHRFVFLDPSSAAPAADVGRLVVGDYADPAALASFLHAVDVVTFEFENVPAAALERISAMAAVPLRPCVEALRTGQDRLHEKTLFREVGMPVPDFEVAASPSELRAAVLRLGTPCIAKTRRMGYDGKGQAVLRDADPSTLDAAWRTLGEGRHGVIVESFVPFSRELSILAVRSASGAFAAYPLVQNVHTGGVLRRSLAPAPAVPVALQKAAEGYAAALMDRLGYIGVLAVEFFEVGGSLLGNEMAPRVHNSGHWTTEGACTSQFESHIRAITGAPLGSTAMAAGASVMLNLVGTEAQAARRALGFPLAKLHWYGKDPRPGRKVGHITVSAETAERALALADEVERAVGDGCGTLVGEVGAAGAVGGG